MARVSMRIGASRRFVHLMFLDHYRGRDQERLQPAEPVLGSPRFCVTHPQSLGGFPCADRSGSVSFCSSPLVSLTRTGPSPPPCSVSRPTARPPNGRSSSSSTWGSTPRTNAPG